MLKITSSAERFEVRQVASESPISRLKKYAGSNLPRHEYEAD